MTERDETNSPRAPTPALGFRTSPFCLHLQSKKRFFLRGEPAQESDLLDASQHCWCRKTMQAIGPDGERVDPLDCRAGRACFASLA